MTRNNMRRLHHFDKLTQILTTGMTRTVHVRENTDFPMAQLLFQNLTIRNIRRHLNRLARENNLITVLKRELILSLHNLIQNRIRLCLIARTDDDILAAISLHILERMLYALRKRK